MEALIERGAALSPLEESSAEVSRDSGLESISSGALSSASEALSHSSSLAGNVSQSPSFRGNVSHSSSFEPDAAAAVNAQSDADQSDSDGELLKRTALRYSTYMRAEAGEEILCLEKSLEEMLTRVDEFVGMLDMIRNDTSQIVNISLPQIHRKSEDMREIYRKIDKLEAFVKMVAANVNAMEEQVTLAEGEVKTIPGAFKKIFRTMTVPGFLNKPASPKRTPQQHQELPTVFRTDDYFTPRSEQSQLL